MGKYKVDAFSQFLLRFGVSFCFLFWVPAQGIYKSKEEKKKKKGCSPFLSTPTIHNISMRERERER